MEHALYAGCLGSAQQKSRRGCADTFLEGYVDACAVAKVLHQGRVGTYRRVDQYSQGVRCCQEEGGGYV